MGKWYQATQKKSFIPQGIGFLLLLNFVDAFATMAISAADASNRADLESGLFWGSIGVYLFIACGLFLLKLCCFPRKSQIRTSQATKSEQKDECNNSCKYYSKNKENKRSTSSTVKRHLLDIALDFLTIFMGTLYLIGDNLPRDACRNQAACMSVANTFSTISLVLNTVLTQVRKTGLWSESWSKLPTVGSQQEHWIQLFVALSQVVLLNQILTSGFEYLPSVATLLGDSSTCGAGTHVGGSFILVFGVFGWALYVTVTGLRNFLSTKKCNAEQILDNPPSTHKEENAKSETQRNPPSVNNEENSNIETPRNSPSVNNEENANIETSGNSPSTDNERKAKTDTKHSKSVKYHDGMGYCACCGLEFLMIVYVALYMFGDLYWPWNCFESDREWKIARAIILGIACLISLVLAWVYIAIAIIPSLHAVIRGDFFLQGRSIESLFGFSFRSHDGNVKVSEFRVNGAANDKLRFDAEIGGHLDTLSNSMTFKSDTSWTNVWKCCCPTKQSNIESGGQSKKGAGCTGDGAFNITSLVYATKSNEATLLVLDQRVSEEERETLLKMFPTAKIH